MRPTGGEEVLQVMHDKGVPDCFQHFPPSISSDQQPPCPAEGLHSCQSRLNPAS